MISAFVGVMKHRKAPNACIANKSTLQGDVLVVFERACREEDFEVADHLLAALEAIARRQQDEEQLAPAYLIFANACCTH